MRRCGRCDSSDLAVTDLIDGLRTICLTCGWVTEDTE